MANVFETIVSSGIGTANTNVGGSPGTQTRVTAASTTETIIGLTLGNKTASAINVDVEYHNGTHGTFLIKGAPIPSGSSLVPIGGDQKIVLTTGDSIRVKSDTLNSVDATMSILQST